MSGKSNLIECLKFLQDAIARPTRNETSAFHEAFSKRGGFSELVWRGEPEGQITIDLAADLIGTAGKASYSYELSFRQGEYGPAELTSEKLAVNKAGKSATLIENAAGKLKLNDGKHTQESPQNTFCLALQVYGYDGSSDISRFRQYITSWRFYSLIPALMRESNPPEPAKYLSEHGENLSAWLLTLQTYPREFNRINEACADVLPGLGKILFQPVEGPQRTQTTGTTNVSFAWESAKISVGASEARFKKPISLGRMSDGELAFLALLSVILAPEELSPPLLSLGEPENFLHPRLIEVLIELLEQRSIEAKAPQIVVTTHSPLLVDKLNIDELVVLQRVNGATKFDRPSTKRHLRELLSRKESSLGDLWYSGALSDS